MMQPTNSIAQNIPGSPATTTSGGGAWSFANNLLGTAAQLYAQKEAARAAQNPQLVYLEKAYENPVPTGQAVQVETAKVQPGSQAESAQDVVNIAGVKVPRVAALIGGALLAAIVIKKAGIL